MDPRLLHRYDQELRHLREMGAEFAQAFPKVAARLGMDGTEVADPYVERLLEGAAFLAARVQVRLDAEFPRFTQRLLELLYPGYLAPTPSMLIARLEPGADEPGLARGFEVPRGSCLRAAPGPRQATGCTFRTAHAVTLWPIEIAAAEYFTHAPDVPLAAAFGARVRGGVRLRLRATAGVRFEQIEAQRLRLFLGGADEVAHRLYELCAGAALGAMVGPAQRPWTGGQVLPDSAVRRAGFAEDEALLPAGLRVFQGYRLLQEYFAFAHRFLFVDLELGEALRRCGGDELDVVIAFSRGDAALERAVDARDFALHCTPAINLFAKRADRIALDDGQAASDLHVVADRTRPLDFEVYEVSALAGHGAGGAPEQAFSPLYAARSGQDAPGAFFTVQREPRLPSEAQRRDGARSGYVGSEVFVSLTDPQEAPWRASLRQLSVATLCTNRDLPLAMPLGAGRTDFTLDIAAPVAAIRCVKGPSRPQAPPAEGQAAWRLVAHLALNYASLLDSGDQGAAALREMLALYAAGADTGARKQVEGVRSVAVERVVRRLPAPGPIAFGRGLRIVVEIDELAFRGAGAFLFGCVLEQFFARYVSINAFAETVLRSTTRGEIHGFAPRWGERPVA